ncbi:hypothetical protein SLEP1_g3322 [Rubroshorea leprosula]|uniref:Cyclic nucleotide-binding domain-containing protein n=1 Tax=Rubroshorea leprosula TaxID=152421 RepID=A0AAV5HVU6_9ROSI|nr:hypothetical protein SLEP1_g3322 [Rubroshorea leprosula]
MLFIVQGKLEVQGDPKTNRFGEGDFFGEELLQLGFNADSCLPKSNILVRALTLVEAFALEPDDLKSNRAAMVLQSAWQRHKLRRVVKEAVERKERRSRPRILSGTIDSKSSHAALAKWEPFKKLSGALQWKVNDYMLYKSQGITDVDLVMLLHKLPKELSTQMKSELCFDLLNKNGAPKLFSITLATLLAARSTGSYFLFPFPSFFLLWDKSTQPSNLFQVYKPCLPFLAIFATCLRGMSLRIECDACCFG